MNYSDSIVFNQDNFKNIGVYSKMSVSFRQERKLLGNSGECEVIITMKMALTFSETRTCSVDIIHGGDMRICLGRWEPTITIRVTPTIKIPKVSDEDVQESPNRIHKVTEYIIIGVENFMLPKGIASVTDYWLERKKPTYLKGLSLWTVDSLPIH